MLSSYGNIKMRISHIRLIKRKSSLTPKAKVYSSRTQGDDHDCLVNQELWDCSRVVHFAFIYHSDDRSLSAAPKSAQTKYGIVTC